MPTAQCPNKDGACAQIREGAGGAQIRKLPRSGFREVPITLGCPDKVGAHYFGVGRCCQMHTLNDNIFSL